MVEKELPDGRVECADKTVITDAKETSTVVDKAVSGQHVHKEVVDKDVDGVHVHEETEVTEKNVKGGHVTQIVHDADVGNAHLHEETVITDKPSESFHKEVTNATTTSDAGVVSELRVTTDKQVNGERIHTELVEKEGPDGQECEDLTVITNGKETTTVIDSVINGDHLHAERKVTEEVVGGHVCHKVVHDVTTSKEHVHEENMEA
eukprot:TRINITY_DN417_c0_g1_i3.p2 TRINITY_DN417_c0_g1~~TRINITY_DN417_c0_g1_i3.p2  ORF type:complete len:206 (+),score=111.38 TRINITY_DN417_c0_g1_i3:291-908(+)